MAYIATVTSKGQITIPKSIREFLGLSQSSQVSFVKQDRQVVVKPIPEFMSLKNSVKGKKYSDKKADQAVGRHLAQQYGKKN